MAKAIRASVDELAGKLETALGDNLVSFMLYGPAVRAEQTPEATTLLILRDASPRSLRSIEAEIAHWTKKGHPPPLIFSERGWRGSADVFPIEIEDMREAHLLIRGDDPLATIETKREDLRRELEREIRGKLLQLRTEFTATASNGKALSTLLTDSVKTFFILFRAVLRLVGRTPPETARELVADTAEVSGFDAAAFQWVLARVSGEKTSPLNAYDPIGDRYLEQIEQLAHFVDSFDPADASTPSAQGS